MKRMESAARNSSAAAAGPWREWISRGFGRAEIGPFGELAQFHDAEVVGRRFVEFEFLRQRQFDGRPFRRGFRRFGANGFGFDRLGLLRLDFRRVEFPAAGFLGNRHDGRREDQRASTAAPARSRDAASSSAASSGVTPRASASSRSSATRGRGRPIRSR